MSTAAGTIYRFGDYELTLVPLALSRRGVPIKVRSQPLQLLALLAAHPGELVTHEDIRRALWNRRIVDFSRSVHVCVGQLRAALGDEMRTRAMSRPCRARATASWFRSNA